DYIPDTGQSLGLSLQIPLSNTFQNLLGCLWGTNFNLSASSKLKQKAASDGKYEIVPHLSILEKGKTSIHQWIQLRPPFAFSSSSEDRIALRNTAIFCDVDVLQRLSSDLFEPPTAVCDGEEAVKVNRNLFGFFGSSRPKGRTRMNGVWIHHLVSCEMPCRRDVPPTMSWWGGEHMLGLERC
ncbi:hypothetical protein NPIL_189501, partial [Nephila pilipes]